MTPSTDGPRESSENTVVCPPWCSRQHTEQRFVEDDLVHVSDDCALDPFDNPPRTVFNLVSYENAQGTRPPLLEMSVLSGDGFLPASHQITSRAQVDTAITQLEHAAAVLKQWRTVVPE